MNYTPPLWPGIDESDFSEPPKPKGTSMKYKLLQPLPGFTATIYERRADGMWTGDGKLLSDMQGRWLDHIVDKNPDFFQPIDDKPERWRAEDGGVFWYMDDAGAVGYKHDEYWMTMDEERHKIGNYFRTEQQASKAAEAIRALLSFIQGDAIDNGQWPAVVSEARKATQEDRE